MPTQDGSACSSAMISGASTAGSTRPIEARVCCRNIARTAISMRLTRRRPLLRSVPGLCPGPHQEAHWSALRGPILDLRQGQWPLDPLGALMSEVADTDLARSRLATSLINAINRFQRASPFGGGSKGAKPPWRVRGQSPRASTFAASRVSLHVGASRRRCAMSYETISVAPVTPVIGAEVSGIDLSRPLGNQQFQEVHDALMENLVIFFRDQRLTHDQHKEFGRLFGELTVH